MLNKNPVLRSFEVNYHNGKCTIIADGKRRVFIGSAVISAAMIRQILETLNPELQRVFGDYVWTLQWYETGEYAICACNGTHGFFESFGKTPKEAFWNCYQIRAILS